MTAADPTGTAPDLAYPAPPWHMTGQQWLSLFKVRRGVDDLRPAGVYAVAWVSYEEPSPLTYHELLVARALESGEHGRRVTITDIWVDSAASVAGGREIWAIPKDLCDFDHETRTRGPVSSTTWSASVDGRPVVSASFRDVSRAAPRLPFKGGAWQPGIEDTSGEDRTATMQGSGKSLPCRSSWDFDPGGPLGWLADARRLASFRMADFRMSFT